MVYIIQLVIFTIKSTVGPGNRKQNAKILPLQYHDMKFKITATNSENYFIYNTQFKSDLTLIATIYKKNTK